MEIVKYDITPIMANLFTAQVHDNCKYHYSALRWADGGDIYEGFGGRYKSVGKISFETTSHVVCAKITFVC